MLQKESKRYKIKNKITGDSEITLSKISICDPEIVQKTHSAENR
jgi:hypothetical protein